MKGETASFILLFKGRFPPTKKRKSEEKKKTPFKKCGLVAQREKEGDQEQEGKSI